MAYFDKYKARPMQRFTSSLWNTVMDELSAMYGTLDATYKRGTPASPWDQFYGNKGFFSDALYVQGKPVIKDGDPITVYDISTPAQTAISKAIDSSIVSQIYCVIPTKRVEDILSQVYGVETGLAKESTQSTIASYASSLPRIEQYTRESRDVLVKLKIDTYGNMGVIIAQPIDVYGNVRVSSDLVLQDIFKPVSASGSISGAYNTAGFSVSLNKGGRPHVNVFYYLGGAGNVYVEVSLDGITWRTIDTIALSASGSGFRTYTLAYPYVRVRTDTAGIDVTFEIVASR